MPDDNKKERKAANAERHIKALLLVNRAQSTLENLLPFFNKTPAMGKAAYNGP